MILPAPLPPYGDLPRSVTAAGLETQHPPAYISSVRPARKAGWAGARVHVVRALSATAATTAAAAFRPSAYRSAGSWIGRAAGRGRGNAAVTTASGRNRRGPVGAFLPDGGGGACMPRTVGTYLPRGRLAPPPACPRRHRPGRTTAVWAHGRAPARTRTTRSAGSLYNIWVFLGDLSRPAAFWNMEIPANRINFYRNFRSNLI